MERDDGEAKGARVAPCRDGLWEHGKGRLHRHVFLMDRGSEPGEARVKQTDTSPFTWMGMPALYFGGDVRWSEKLCVL